MSDLLEFPIPIAPHKEQGRLAEELDSLLSDLESAVRSLKSAQNRLKRYRQAVLKAAVEGELSREWREAHAGEVEPAEVLLKRILAERKRTVGTANAAPARHEGWTVATIDQLVSVQTGATPLRGKVEYYSNASVPWVTSGALNEEFVDSPTELISDTAVRETNAKVFPVGTLLVAMYGEGKTRGKVSELRIEAATNQACAALVFEGGCSAAIRPFLKLFFLHNYEDLRKLAAGGVQPNLNLRMIKDTTVALPPMEEQKLIVNECTRYLSVIDVLAIGIKANPRRATRLRQAILEKAFRGESVPQDPNDEPASVLLERIRAERMGRPPEKRAKRNKKGLAAI